MKNPTFITLAAMAVAAANLQAAVIEWADTPSTRTDGPVDGLATQIGSGNYQTSGNVAAVNGSGVVLTADGGADVLQVVSTASAATGNFAFNVSLSTTGPNVFFLQMNEGPNRSTGNNPSPNFAFSFNFGSLSVTNGDLATIVFNVSGADYDYTAPDNSQQTLANQTFDVWIANTLEIDGSEQSNNEGGFPTGGIDTITMTTFNGQEGAVFTFDNLSLNVDSVVPEPSTSMLFGVIGCLGLLRRRRH